MNLAKFLPRGDSVKCNLRNEPFHRDLTRKPWVYNGNIFILLVLHCMDFSKENISVCSVLTFHSKVLSISKHLSCESSPLLADHSNFTASIQRIELWEQDISSKEHITKHNSETITNMKHGHIHSLTPPFLVI